MQSYPLRVNHYNTTLSHLSLNLTIFTFPMFNVLSLKCLGIDRKYDHTWRRCTPLLPPDHILGVYSGIQGGCSSPVVQGPENHLKPYIFLSRGEAYTWGRGMIAPKALRGARLSGCLPTSPVKRPCGGKMLG